MFSLDAIDVAIGLALLFLILSLLCTSLREAIEGIMKTRASDLERGIRQLLQDDGELTERFYQHPLIYSLYAGDYKQPDPKATIRRGGNLPSYIPANQFARALLDLIHQGAAAYSVYGAATGSLTIASVREAAAQFPNPQIRRAVLSAIDHANGDLEAARRNLEGWFNGTMDRVSGWYKRRTQLILFVIGILVAVVLNVDAITVAQRLQRDKVLREAVVTNAMTVAKSVKSADELADQPEALAAKLDSYGFPIGWKGLMPAAQLQARFCPKAGAAPNPAAKAPDPRAAPNPSAKAPDPRCDSAWVLLGHRDGDWLYVLSGGAIVQMLIGWLITAVAMMLGAPFWFDVLNRLMVIRSTVKPTEKSPDEASEDRPRSAKPEESQEVVRSQIAGGQGADVVLDETIVPPPEITPAGFPFVAKVWADEAEEGVV